MLAASATTFRTAWLTSHLPLRLVLSAWHCAFVFVCVCARTYVCAVEHLAQYVCVRVCR